MTGGAVIAGDLVSTVSTIVIDPPEGNMADYLASLARVRDQRIPATSSGRTIHT